MADNQDNLKPKINQTNQNDQASQFPGAESLDNNNPEPVDMKLPGEESQGSNQANFKPKRSFKPSKKLSIIIASILGLLLLAAAAWFLVSSKDQSDQASSDQQGQQSAEKIEPNPASASVGQAELSQSYTNDFLRLTFNYPTGWEVNDVNDVMTVKSPTFLYKLADGSKKDGFFKVYIRKQASKDDGKYLGRGYAVNASEKISYSQPQTGQKTETFLSDFGLDSADNFAYFVVQGTFELKKGDSLGPNYASEPEAYLITGGFASDGQEDGLATNSVTADSYKSEQTYITAVEIVKSLQLK